MIYLTGDTHIPMDIHKISMSQWPDQKSLTKDDYLIVCGDFGLLFNYRETGKSISSCPEDSCWDEEELWWLNWLQERPFTTLFVDGNHENYDRLKKYPITDWNDGKVQIISDSVIHLIRGQVYQIGKEKSLSWAEREAMTVGRQPIPRNGSHTKSGGKKNCL